MKQFDIGKIEDLFNDLAEDEVNLLPNILQKIDRLEVDPMTGDPKWSDDEMDLIGRFHGLEGTEIVPSRTDIDDPDEPDPDAEDEGALQY